MRLKTLTRSLTRSIRRTSDRRSVFVSDQNAGMAKVVLLLGAGASVSDVATRSARTRPPLDHGFFTISASARANDTRVGLVRTYLDSTYGIDIFARSEHDSLEGVMARLYPDLFNRLLEKQALRAFRALLQLFTDRLATTTNSLRATQKRLLYRMLSRLSRRRSPRRHHDRHLQPDLQVEKILEHLSETKRWRSIAPQLFCFPEMYSVAPDTWDAVTGPSRASPTIDVFPECSSAGLVYSRA